MNSTFTPFLSVALIGVAYACGAPDRDPKAGDHRLESPAWHTETTGASVPAGKDTHFHRDAGAVPLFDRDIGPAVR